MTMLLVSDGEAIDELGTNTGYGSLIDWTDEHSEECPLLSHLVDYGWIDDLPGLTKELTEVNAEGDIADAIQRIREAAKTAKGNTLQITNGLVEDDGEDGESADDETELAADDNSQY
jgi:hypothetical protein